MIVIWKDGQPDVRCKPNEFADHADAQWPWLQAIEDLCQWGMTHRRIAEAINASHDSVRGWVRYDGSRRPLDSYILALKRLHTAASEAVAKGPPCST